ncbi:MAG: H(+)/Cl(-) exchange transporter ClcA [Candidatus Ozemobacteraceae bacterium]
MRSRRRFQFMWAVMVGSVAGLVAVSFQLALNYLEFLRSELVALLRVQGWGPTLTYPLLAMAIVALVAWGTRKFCPEAAGSGIPHIKGVLMGVRDLKSLRLIIVKFLGGILAIGSGLSLGREGPTVQMGGAIGQIFASRMGMSSKGAPLLIAVGAGAGLSAAFNAPLAGFLFVMEELHFEFAPLPYISALAASITGDLVSRLMSGQLPSLIVFSYSTPQLTKLPWFVLLGVLSGCLAILFKESLVRGIRLLDHHQPVMGWVLPLLAGCAGGLAVLVLPEVAGGGHVTTENILNGNFSTQEGFGFIFLLLVSKFLLTQICYLARVPGGIFAPMLVIGGLLGYGLGIIQGYFSPGFEAHPAIFAVIGMASFFSGVVHAPLTGVVLVMEMTSNFKLLFPMMAASLVAFTISEWWGEAPVYEALLAEELRRSGPPQLIFQEPTCIHAIVNEGSEMDQRTIGEIDLPEGALIVCINRNGQKSVPSGKSMLCSGDDLEIMISGEISPCLQEIRELAMVKKTEDPLPG